MITRNVETILDGMRELSLDIANGPKPTEPENPYRNLDFRKGWAACLSWLTQLPKSEDEQSQPMMVHLEGREELQLMMDAAARDEQMDDRFDWTDCSVVSSNVERYGYNSRVERLRVQFKSGKSYDYYDVPFETYNELSAADSVGKYFAANIKGKFSSALVPE